MNTVLKRMLIYLATLLSLVVVPAAALNVDIVIADGNPATLNLARAAEHALQQIQPVPITRVVTIDSIDKNIPRETLLIAVGDDMLNWVMSTQNNYAASLCFYVSSSSYAPLAEKTTKTALFRDQPLSRQLQLARTLLPDARNALVIHSQPLFADATLSAAQYANFQLHVYKVDASQDWAKPLSRWVSENDVLIGIEDRDLYNRSTIRSVLLTTYRHGKVLIGPNRGFVGAGSLASTYTSPEQYLLQLQAMVQSWQDSRTLPPAQYPNLYQININRQVANSLGLNLPDDQVLLKTLQNQQRHIGELPR